MTLQQWIRKLGATKHPATIFTLFPLQLVPGTFELPFDGKHEYEDPDKAATADVSLLGQQAKMLFTDLDTGDLSQLPCLENADQLLSLSYQMMPDAGQEKADAASVDERGNESEPLHHILYLFACYLESVVKAKKLDATVYVSLQKVGKVLTANGSKIDTKAYGYLGQLDYSIFAVEKPKSHQVKAFFLLLAVELQNRVAQLGHPGAQIRCASRLMNEKQANPILVANYLQAACFVLMQLGHEFSSFRGAYAQAVKDLEAQAGKNAFVPEIVLAHLLVASAAPPWADGENYSAARLLPELEACVLAQGKKKGAGSDVKERFVRVLQYLVRAQGLPGSLVEMWKEVLSSFYTKHSEGHKLGEAILRLPSNASGNVEKVMGELATYFKPGLDPLLTPEALYDATDVFTGEVPFDDSTPAFASAPALSPVTGAAKQTEKPPAVNPPDDGEYEPVGDSSTVKTDEPASSPSHSAPAPILVVRATDAAGGDDGGVRYVAVDDGSAALKALLKTYISHLELTSGESLAEDELLAKFSSQYDNQFPDGGYEAVLMQLRKPVALVAENHKHLSACLTSAQRRFALHYPQMAWLRDWLDDREGSRELKYILFSRFVSKMLTSIDKKNVPDEVALLLSYALICVVNEDGRLAGMTQTFDEAMGVEASVHARAADAYAALKEVMPVLGNLCMLNHVVSHLRYVERVAEGVDADLLYTSISSPMKPGELDGMVRSLMLDGFSNSDIELSFAKITSQVLQENSTDAQLREAVSGSFAIEFAMKDFLEGSPEHRIKAFIELTRQAVEDVANIQDNDAARLLEQHAKSIAKALENEVAWKTVAGHFLAMRALLRVVDQCDHPVTTFYDSKFGVAPALHYQAWQAYRILQVLTAKLGEHLPGSECEADPASFICVDCHPYHAQLAQAASKPGVSDAADQQPTLAGADAIVSTSSQFPPSSDRPGSGLASDDASAVPASSSV